MSFQTQKGMVPLVPPAIIMTPPRAVTRGHAATKFQLVKIALAKNYLKFRIFEKKFSLRCTFYSLVSFSSFFNVLILIFKKIFACGALFFYISKIICLALWLGKFLPTVLNHLSTVPLIFTSRQGWSQSSFNPTY